MKTLIKKYLLQSRLIADVIRINYTIRTLANLGRKLEFRNTIVGTSKQFVKRIFANVGEVFFCEGFQGAGEFARRIAAEICFGVSDATMTRVALGLTSPVIPVSDEFESESSHKLPA